MHPDPILLYSKPYYNTAKKDNPRSGDTYTACQKIKESDFPVPGIEDYAKYIGNNAVLIPVPDHTGNTTANAALATQLCLAKQHRNPACAKVRVLDILTCETHESLCERKRSGLNTDDININMSITAAAAKRLKAFTGMVILVDGVLDTGKTVLAAYDALKEYCRCHIITIGYTGRDKGIYNPLGMLEELKKHLLNYYYLQDEPPQEIPHDIIEKCIQQGSLFSDNNEWDHNQLTKAQEIANYILDKSKFDEKHKKEFKNDYLYDDFVDEIIIRDRSTPLKDSFMCTLTHARVELISNYDCLTPPYETNWKLYSKYTVLWGLMATLSLNPRKVKEQALSIGMQCAGQWPNIKKREGNEIVSYEQFLDVINESPNYGIWSFFGRLDMDKLYDRLRDNDNKFNDAIIPKGTACTIYNSWNGGGSLATATTLRDITIDELRRRAKRYKDSIKICVDEKNCTNCYASCEVYGKHLSEDKILI